MLLGHVKRLCILSASLIVAVPHNAAPTVTSVPSLLPTDLQQDIPSCAHSCIQSSLSQRFPIACTAEGDLECLCSRYSTTGESLGEVALGCVYASCSSIDTAASAYNVCLGQKNAVLPTKTALTIVPSSTSSKPSTSSTTSRALISSSVSTSRATITSIRRTTLQTKASSSQSVFVDSISVPASATSTSSSTPTSIAAPAVKDERPRMTPAQIAGLTVAAVAAFIIAIGLMALSVFLRRRKERKSTFVNEKDEDRRRQQLARFSHYVPVDDIPASSISLPIGPPPPTAQRDGPRYPRLVTPSPFSTLGMSSSGSGRTIVRPGVGTSASTTSVPMSQIGLAISAELEGCPAPAKSSNHPRQKVTEDHFRPISTRTEATVFEEDELTARRRSSRLLPTPPVPIMPIRSLQPSRLPLKAPSTSNPHTNHTTRHSELFINIPVRHERPLPKRIIPAGLSATGSPAPKRPAPQLQIPLSTSQQASSTTTSTTTPASAADIPAYYFSDRSLPERDNTPRQDSDTLPVSKTRKTPRAPSSTTAGSRTISKTSTRPTFRDSVSSQTSFETADPNDPTPEGDSDKQLSDDKLSPVAESPIHGLKYPKVPRASNQLVPRSPPRRSREEGHFYVRPLPEPSSLLVKRRGERQAVQLEKQLSLKDPFTTPTRRELRAHQIQPRRNVSGTSWEHTPASKIERHSYTNSPSVHHEDVIRPLSIVKKTDVPKECAQGGEMVGLKSPVWIPHLTPTRKGDDLFISVGWGDRPR
ncbi:Def1-like protein [Stagonosporopsis vannaccii]|nr:Def1-like protein [Stagonosporopsis vannaccii]